MSGVRAASPAPKFTKYYMLLISYRGIYDGQNLEQANTPNQLGSAFNHGFACMVDAWRVDNKLYLGNEQPLTEVSAEYLRGGKFWINARNNDMYTWLQNQPSNLYPNYFVLPVPTPEYVTTSSGYLWTPGTVPINNNSIVFLPEIQDRGLLSTVKLRCYGICSIYLTFIRRTRNEGVWY